MRPFEKRSPAPLASGNSRAHPSMKRENISAARAGIEPADLQRVAQRLHACGERVVFEFMADLARGRDFAETVADFARLDPKRYAAVAALVIDGGRA